MGVRPLVLAGALLGMVACGCGIATVVGPTQDTFATWSVTPLAPSADLASLVLGGKNGCTLDPAGGPARILIQDRRTTLSAGFLLANTTSFGSCMITGGSGASSSGWGPLPAAMAGSLTIDDNGSGTFGAGQATEIGGRVDPSASTITVVLASGATVQASVSNGYWFAWWPNLGAASSVVATDANGVQIANVAVTK